MARNKLRSLQEAWRQDIISQHRQNQFDKVSLLELSRDIFKMFEVALLTPREVKIIMMRFGFNNEDDEKTLSEIGRLFEVGGNAIRMAEAKAFRKMRHPRALKVIKDHIKYE